jgi:hypothetical protein
MYHGKDIQDLGVCCDPLIFFSVVQSSSGCCAEMRDRRR